MLTLKKGNNYRNYKQHRNSRLLILKNIEKTDVGFSGYQDRSSPGVWTWEDILSPSKCQGLEDLGKVVFSSYQHPLERGSLIPITLLAGEGKSAWKIDQ